MNALTADLATTLRLVLFTLVFITLALAELRWPRRALSTGRLKRWTANLGLSVVNTLAVRVIVPIAGVASAAWAAENGWGFFNQLPLPNWLEVVLFLLIFDCF